MKLLKYIPHIAVLAVSMLAVAGTMATQATDKTIYPKTGAEFAEISAMILAKSKTSGGSGVILHSDLNGSILLTNKHVCEVIQEGGFVETTKLTAEITHYKEYPKHDLCLVNVKVDLGIRTQIAMIEPKLYSEMTISGHPALLPPIVSKGLFSDRKEIDVMTGMKECDGTETEEEMFYCFFYGGKPIIEKFDSQVTSGLIMPGSSGSPVFNDRGEIAGLVFAGSSGLSYGFIVPHQYVFDFVSTHEKYPWVKVGKEKESKRGKAPKTSHRRCNRDKNVNFQKIKCQEIWSAE